MIFIKKIKHKKPKFLILINLTILNKNSINAFFVELLFQ